MAHNQNKQYSVSVEDESLEKDQETNEVNNPLTNQDENKGSPTQDEEESQGNTCVICGSDEDGQVLPLQCRICFAHEDCLRPFYEDAPHFSDLADAESLEETELFFCHCRKAVVPNLLGRSLCNSRL